MNWIKRVQKNFKKIIADFKLWRDKVKTIKETPIEEIFEDVQDGTYIHLPTPKQESDMPKASDIDWSKCDYAIGTTPLRVASVDERVYCKFGGMRSNKYEAWLDYNYADFWKDSPGINLCVIYKARNMWRVVAYDYTPDNRIKQVTRALRGGKKGSAIAPEGGEPLGWFCIHYDYVRVSSIDWQPCPYKDAWIDK